MSIPDFQTVMRPLLEFISDGREHSMREALDGLSSHFGLSDKEREQLLPSAQQEIFTNRVAWANIHLRMAGLLDEGTARGVFKITDRGAKILKEIQGRIDLKVLQAQPGYLEAQGRHAGKPESAPTPTRILREDQTPEEAIEDSYLRLREYLGREILTKLASSSPAFFGRLVVDLLVRMGYGGTRKDAGQAIGKSGDEGVDGIIKEDRFGLDTIYIQAKKWENPVSRPEIEKFAGALQGFGARKGIFITTSDFSKEAVDYASRIDSKIVLIDGEQLWNLMIDYSIGVSPVATFEIKRIDNDYFNEEVV